MGCYRCKSIRKKCDEKKSECSRCIRRGTKCKYVYIEPNGQGFKNRTMPGRRSKSQLGQNEHPSDELPLATPPLTSEAPTYNPAYVDQPELQLSVDIPLPFDTTPCSALSTLFPQSTLAEPFTGNPPITLCYAATPQSILSTATSNQAGYYNAMRATLPNLNPPVPIAFSLDTEEDDNEESDDEGIKRIICTIPRLFGTVDDTSIEFVLENYARWIPLTLFDPLKVVRKTKLIVLHQFALSATSRSRVLLVARLMNILVNKRALDEQGVMILELLKDTILKDVIGCSLRYPISDETRQQAASALCNVLELMVIQFLGAPLNSAIKFFEVAVPVFLAACPPPHPPRLLDIFLDPSLSLRHFAATDVILGVITGRATHCRYHIPWSLELSDHLLERQENQGAEWLVGIPDQFILVLAYITNLRRDAQLHVSRCNNYGRARHAESSSWYNQSTGSSGSGLGDWKGALDSTMMKKLEDDISRIRILPGESDDPALRITRIIVQECWREVVYICFYMALCGASAEDPRVQQAQKKYMRLLDGTKPGRNPDRFLSVPMIIVSLSLLVCLTTLPSFTVILAKPLTSQVGLATMKPKHRRTLTSRTLGLAENLNPWTAGNDLVRMLDNIWTRTAMEGRGAYWDDLSIAFQSVTGM